jgi:hypothetical protein
MRGPKQKQIPFGNDKQEKSEVDWLRGYFFGITMGISRVPTFWVFWS